MLVECKECGLKISDQAVFCPHCGLPIRPNKLVKISKPKRLPNGFGQITKLNVKGLRKPYRAMITVGKTDEGKPISKLLKPVAYFETYNEAYNALVIQNKNPYDINKDASFEEVYEEWYEEHTKKISDARARGIRYTWKKLAKYKDVRLGDLKPKFINQIIEEHSDESGEVRKKIKSLINQVMDYATANEIIEKNYSRISNIKIENPNEVVKGHMTFTPEEISKIWADDDYVARWTLIQCYTGMRPGELCLIELANINLDENYMVGGIKTKAGINRRIPIHDAIRSLLEAQIQESTNRGSKYLLSEEGLNKIAYEVYKRRFYDMRDRLGLNPEHTPHDCRKYFISQAKKYKLDEYAIKRIVGHNISDITERTYTERDPQWLYQEINKIIV